jgi:superoxide dismutase, Cu-Zn family
MRLPTHFALLPAMLVLGACATAGQLPTSRLASAALKQANGLPAGTAQLLSNGETVTLSLALVGLSKGEHGVHLHAAGACEAPGFTSAGGHLNPGGKQHGTSNPAGHHLGDLPNVTIGGSGAGTLSIDLPGTPEALMAELFDADGSAIVVHAGPDDYVSDPSGNSGSRIACGELKRR